jgi:hypothetical protein
MCCWQAVAIAHRCLSVHERTATPCSCALLAWPWIFIHARRRRYWTRIHHACCLVSHARQIKLGRGYGYPLWLCSRAQSQEPMKNRLSPCQHYFSNTFQRWNNISLTTNHHQQQPNFSEMNRLYLERSQRLVLGRAPVVFRPRSQALLVFKKRHGGWKLGSYPICYCAACVLTPKMCVPDPFRHCSALRLLQQVQLICSTVCSGRRITTLLSNSSSSGSNFNRLAAVLHLYTS